MKMIRRTLIAIAVVALVATSTSAQTLGPKPHEGGGNSPAIKVNLERLEIGWPFEFTALELCVVPVFMNVGFFVQVENCADKKIKLEQVDCGDIGKGGEDWPCYLDCEDIRIRSNFEVKLGTKLNREGPVIDQWEAYYDGTDIVSASGDYETVTVCVKAWRAQLFRQPPGSQVRVGTLVITVKPNV